MLTAREHFLGDMDYAFLKVTESKLIHTLLEVPTKWLDLYPNKHMVSIESLCSRSTITVHVILKDQSISTNTALSYNYCQNHFPEQG